MSDSEDESDIVIVDTESVSSDSESSSSSSSGSSDDSNSVEVVGRGRLDFDWAKWNDFSPVFDLLFPRDTVNVLLLGMVAAPLIEFLESWEIQTISDLGRLGGRRLFRSLPRDDCAISPEQQCWTEFETICNYVSVYGEAQFRKAKVKYRLEDKNLGAMQVAVEDYWKQCPKEISTLLPNDNFPWLLRRRLLHSLMHGQKPTELRKSAEARQEWLAKGALELMEAFPILASEPCYDHEKLRELGRGRRNCLPLSYFVSSGFNVSVLQRILNLYPEALANDRSEELDSLLRCKLPLFALKNLMELKPELLKRTTDSITKGHLLFEMVFHLYDVSILETLAISHWPQDETRLRLNMQTHATITSRAICLNRKRISVLKHILPKLEHLEITNQRSWSLDGFNYFVDSLVNYGNNLRSLKLTIPTKTLLSGDGESLRDLLSNKPQQMKHMELDRLEGGKDCEASDFCLQQLFCGIMLGHNTSPTWCLEKLTLKRFAFKRLAREGEPNSSHWGVLIFSDVTGSIVVRNNSNHFADWQVRQTNKKRPLGVLDLCEPDIETPAWLRMWRSVAEANMMEKIFIASDQQMALGHGNIACLSRLRHLYLGAGNLGYREGTIDITGELAELLKHGSLQYLCIEGTRYLQSSNDATTTPFYSIDMRDLAKALPMACQLRYIALRNVAFEGPYICERFLDGVNTSFNLEHAEMYNQKKSRFYSFFPTNHWHVKELLGMKFVHRKVAGKLEALTRCNRELRLGIGKVRDKHTTLQEFVELIDGVESRFDPYDIEATGAHLSRFTRNSKASNDQTLKEILANTLSQDLSPSNVLEMIFQRVQEAPVAVSHALLRHLEVMTMKYKLLREVPSLWCNAASIPRSPRQQPSRKRKHSERSDFQS